MKNYFIRLFNYNQYVNKKIAETIITANAPEKPVQLMAHLLTAEQVWLRRCKGEYQFSAVLWPNLQAAELDQIINDNHRLWVSYLNIMDDTAFEKLITYKNFSGYEFTTSVTDMITQVINHGTHTRAQTGVYLKLAGIEKLPVTDFSFYINSII
ncbi:DinB family protein [Mucilaginibacter sp.]|uniref:DinB family protein n=1 Tax=Mucilaginibacter sp. TaxID=1882438 RepID=UPI002619EB08|nr:DinB family protein [Mucilaginibacter sp.]MDB4925363.1 hypothetical protein [Mucilaginibacter sp.]